MKYEESIKKILIKKADDISLKADILTNIKISVEKENVNMKRFMNKPKRVIILGLAICTVLTAGVIGAGKVSGISSHSSRNDDIKHYPSLSELEDVIDYEPKYVEKLGNYEFDFASPGHSQEYDESDTVVHEYDDISFWYKTDKGILNLSTHPDFSPAQHDLNNEKEIEHNGVKLYYSSIKYKFVPPDYTLTEEDKKLMEAKELEVSYGSQEVEYRNNQSVVWSENGIKYCIMDMDVEISEEELINMAKQVVDSNVNDNV